VKRSIPFVFTVRLSRANSPSICDRSQCLAERVGDEVERLGKLGPAELLDAFDPAHDLRLGDGMVERVHHARPDDVHEVEPLGGHRLGHDVGRLLLRILLAAVGDGRARGQVQTPVDAVVEMEQFLLVPGRLQLLVLVNTEEVGRLGEPGPRLSRRPAIGVVDREVPGRRAPHRESLDDDPVRVDDVMLRDVVDRLQRVDLAGEVVGVAVPAVGLHADRAREQHRRRRADHAADEADFRVRLETPVEPDLEAERMGASLVVGGHVETVRLHRAVDL
jgi:hypothetical protein